jgi:hypothetical protein
LTVVRPRGFDMAYMYVKLEVASCEVGILYPYRD